MYHIYYLRYSLLISRCGNVMASLFLLCLGRIHDKKTTNGDVKNCKCKFLKVDPFIKQYRVSQQVLAGSTGQNNHNGSWWVGWVYPRVVYHSKTFYFCGPLGRKYFQKKINLVSVETDFNFLYCDPSAQPIDTINGGMG